MSVAVEFDVCWGRKGNDKETAMGVSPQKNKFINKQANNLVEKLPFHDIHTYIYKFINKQE